MTKITQITNPVVNFIQFAIPTGYIALKISEILSVQTKADTITRMGSDGKKFYTIIITVKSNENEVIEHPIHYNNEEERDRDYSSLIKLLGS